MNVAVIGAGRVGTALAVLLIRAGHRIVGVSGREATHARAARFLPGVPVLAPANATREAELVVVAVPDDVLPAMIGDLADGGAFTPDRTAAHVSGAIGLDVLELATQAGARRLCIHPLQTMPDVERAIERFPGCAMAVTADDEIGFTLGERIATDIGTNAFRLEERNKPLYHAAAVLASNDVVALSGIALAILAEAGVPDPASALAPLQEATIANVRELGPEQALTGPAVRGDAGTVDRNVAALARRAPDVVPTYVELARATLALATRSGRLDARGRAAVEEVLARWT